MKDYVLFSLKHYKLCSLKFWGPRRRLQIVKYLKSVFFSHKQSMFISFMALNSLQPKCLYVSIKIQSLFCGTYWKQNITRRVFNVYTGTCFSRQQKVSLFVSYVIVLCYGRGRQPIGREFKTSLGFIFNSQSPRKEGA